MKSMYFYKDWRVIVQIFGLMQLRGGRFRWACWPRSWRTAECPCIRVVPTLEALLYILIEASMILITY